MSSPDPSLFWKPVMEEELVNFCLPWPPGGRKIGRWRPPGPAGTELGGASRAGWHWGGLACPPHGSSICNAKMQNEFFFFIFFFLSKPAAQNCFGKGFILLSVAHSCSLKEGKLTEAMKPGSATNTVGLLIHRKYTYILMWVCTLTS